MEDPSSNSSRPASRSLESIITEGYSLDVGEHLSAGFKRFGQEPGIYVAFALVYIALNMVAQSLPLVGILAGLLVSPPLLAGFIFYGRLQQRNEHREFSAFFDGFRGSAWPSLVLQNILIIVFLVLILVVAVLPFFLTFLQDFFRDMLPILTEQPEVMTDEEAREILSKVFPPAVVQAILLATLLVIGVFTLFCLAPFFIVYRNLGAFEALRASAKIVAKSYFKFLLLNVVLWLEIVAGFALCCIGYLAALPITYLSLASAYEEITGD
ncbi:MAG: hypothetical protein ACKO7B_05560 [Flavobacteriales bacterium]